MKVAIHNRVGSFSEGWIEYCEKHNVLYKIVNCYDSNIIDIISDCDLLMWHFHQADSRDVKFAKQLLFSVQASGKKTFPEFNYVWHFDDKIGQKYLLESIRAPLIPTYVFYTKKEAIEWVTSANFPKVFKLRGGASAENVHLVKNKRHAKSLVNRSFGKGFKRYNALKKLNEQINKWLDRKVKFSDVFRAFIRLFYSTRYAKMEGREKGYAYFQDFIPNNNFDIRLIVIGNRAYGMKRMNRKGDFRASGSENFVYDSIDKSVVSNAFETADKLKMKIVAFDYMFFNEKPVIVELSYGFGFKGSGKCPGFWDRDLHWHNCAVKPFEWMMELLLQEQNRNENN